ncbi:MAG: DUF6048 family protein [Bacteroidales bacterium]|nr:DUF6048 family protein [Bacteroidales bacterium]
MRISAFILSSFLLGFCFTTAQAQEETIKETVNNEIAKRTGPATFQGMSLSAEIGKPISYFVGGSTLGTEAALRLNFKNKYFPVAELGFDKYDATNDETNLRYKTAAPYLRIGADFNMLKDKTQNNRMYIGFRLAYTTYKFDASGPNIKDPLWQDSQPFDYEGLSSHRTWFEAVWGLEAEILHNFHMGFMLRYKQRLSEKEPIQATPYYVPGFGTGGSSGFTASYYLTFDLSKKIKKPELKTEK